MSAAPPLASSIEPPSAASRAAEIMTEADYLRIERAATEGLRAEFDSSRRIPMTGASLRHVDLSRRVEEALRSLIAARPAADRAARPLTTFRSDLRLRVPAGRYRYPDVMLTPDPPATLDDEQDTVLNPLPIAEVLSPSTEHVDRGAKLAEYRAIPTLTDYLLIAQDEPQIDHYRRTGGGAAEPNEADRWEVVRYTGEEAEVPLTNLGPLPLGQLYGTG
ncbi:Uma2 family endonuclease [Alienimonas chondri]|uniref:Putative restriction endonuclease domain-containing protein n=1 Tax=Alienimonas chondri TaxID=2681879 RepID=A0ABX1VIF6_9PLAN|nr:Uma2 family endonuclease [Alienimonas chondri]NNJ26596.1 hypothetical protein [Alienimonas chondri]